MNSSFNQIEVPAPAGTLGAVAIAIALSFVIACIEIPARSKCPFRACNNAASWLYWLVLAFGNVVTTLLASVAIVKAGTNLPYHFLMAAFFGVFGFETVLKNTNITMFDKGVLTIQTWIEKALNGAIATSIDKNEILKDYARNILVEMLLQLPEDKINTRILQKLGDAEVGRLDRAAQASSADPRMYKALQLAACLTPGEIAALSRRLPSGQKRSPVRWKTAAIAVGIMILLVVAYVLWFSWK